MGIVMTEDLTLLRDGLIRLFTAYGDEVVARERIPGLRVLLFSPYVDQLCLDA